jgi:hypothetical protein
MMGSRGWKGANECDALSHRARRLVKLSPTLIRKAKRSFWRRMRKEAKLSAQACAAR